MVKELESSLNADGTAYSREGVDQYIADHRPKALFDRAEKLLHESEARAHDMLREAEEKAAALTSDLDKVRSDRLFDIEAELNAIKLKAEDESRKRISDAEKKSGRIIEEAMSKVHALVKTAQGKLEDAKNESQRLNKLSTEKYSEAVAKSGVLISDSEKYAKDEIAKAGDDAEKLRLEAETMLAYAQEESRLIRLSGREDAEKMIVEAEKYRDDVMEWVKDEVDIAHQQVQQYKLYYDDTVSRMVALNTSQLEASRALAAIQFPDGSNLKAHISAAAETEKDTNAENSFVKTDSIEPTQDEPTELFVDTVQPEDDEPELPVELSQTEQAELEAALSSLNSFESFDDSHIVIDNSENK